MQGSVRKGGTTWSYIIDFGKIDGKRRQIEKGGYKTKKEADKALADALYQVNNYGEFVENQKITSQKFLMSLLQPKLRQREPMQQLSDIIHFTGIIIKENSADYLYIKYQ